MITMTMFFIWCIGAFYTGGYLVGFSIKWKWYEYFLVPFLCAFTWPFLLGVIHKRGW